MHWCNLIQALQKRVTKAFLSDCLGKDAIGPTFKFKPLKSFEIFFNIIKTWLWNKFLWNSFKTILKNKFTLTNALMTEDNFDFWRILSRQSDCLLG